MKLLLQKLLPAVLLFGLLETSVHAQTRVATVDLRRLFDNYYKTKTADAALKDRAADMDKSHKELLDSWKKAKEDFTKMSADAADQAVSADERDKRKKAAEEKLKDIKEMEENITQFERQARTTLDEMRRRMRENILGEIKTALGTKAKAGNYTLVVDTQALTITETPMVLYSSGENDLTEALLTQLNATAPAETPAATKPDDKGAKSPLPK
jgi:outer membrane protein